MEHLISSATVALAVLYSEAAWAILHVDREGYEVNDVLEMKLQALTDATASMGNLINVYLRLARRAPDVTELEVDSAERSARDELAKLVKALEVEGVELP